MEINTLRNHPFAICHAMTGWRRYGKGASDPIHIFAHCFRGFASLFLLLLAGGGGCPQISEERCDGNMNGVKSTQIVTSD